MCGSVCVGGGHFHTSCIGLWCQVWYCGNLKRGLLNRVNGSGSYSRPPYQRTPKYSIKQFIRESKHAKRQTKYVSIPESAITKCSSQPLWIYTLKVKTNWTKHTWHLILQLLYWVHLICYYKKNGYLQICYIKIAMTVSIHFIYFFCQPICVWYSYACLGIGQEKFRNNRKDKY